MGLNKNLNELNSYNGVVERLSRFSKKTERAQEVVTCANLVHIISNNKNDLETIFRKKGYIPMAIADIIEKSEEVCDRVKEEYGFEVVEAEDKDESSISPWNFIVEYQQMHIDIALDKAKLNEGLSIENDVENCLEQQGFIDAIVYDVGSAS